MKRQSCIILPVYSLPSKYGCGSLGEEAYKFVDWLSDAGQSIWQILPMGPTGYGNSPYQTTSSFAGNPYFIDLDILCEEGLLKREEYEDISFGSNPGFIDYDALKQNRSYVLRLAYKRGCCDSGFSEFKEKEKRWLPDYSLYMAARKYFGYKSWIDWDDTALKAHDETATENYSKLLYEDKDFHAFLQYKFYSQWEKLKSYAAGKGIKLLGDVPVYVPLDSSDVWAEHQFFLIDKDNVPIDVAGVPPDYFNEEGQLWGNPLYDWDKMKADGYGWWIRRIDGTFRFVDMIRIDHFRGFDTYWAVPCTETTAIRGEWRKGPGLPFVNMLSQWFGKDKFIAEDLGILNDSVIEMRKNSGLPGMKIMQFAFDPKEPSSYLPHCVPENCVYYTGTHDNNTLNGWLSEASSGEIDFAKKYMNLTEDEGVNWGFIRTGMMTPAKIFGMQMQDVLGLGSDARTNIPGTVINNWRWRLLPGQLSGSLSEKLLRVTSIYGRLR